MTTSDEGRTRCDGADPYRHVVELRVHGVSGTPPEALLDRAEVRQVGGDKIAGFYRPVLRTQLRDHQPITTDAATGPGLEGYSWGGITSGARSRALWLIFFPFALANVAPRMLPPAAAALETKPADVTQEDWERQSGTLPGITRTHGVAHWLLRALALTLTVSIVYGAVVIGVVFVGQSCRVPVGGPACHGLPDFLSRLLRASSPGWSLLAGLAVPVVVIAGMWLVSHLARRRYEEKPVPGADDEPAKAPEDCQAPLLRPDLWMGTARIKRLRRIHLRIEFATVAFLTHLALGGSASDPTLWLSAAFGVYALIGIGFRPAGQDDPRWVRVENRLGWAATALLALSLARDIAQHWSGAPTAAAMAGAVQRLDTFWRLLYAVQGVLVLALLACCLVLRARRGVRVQQTHLWGIAAVIVAFAAWLSGLIITNSVILLTGAWLFVDGFSLTPAAMAGLLDGHSELFGDATLSGGYGMIAALALLLATLLVVGTSLWIAARRDRRAIPETLPGVRPSAYDLRREAGIHRTGRLADHVTWIVMPPVLAMAAYLAAQAVGYLADGAAVWPLTWFGTLHVTRDSANAPLIATGALLTAGLLVLVIVISMASYRSRSTRRGVGVLWDLACFWPRDVHPLAPPAYSERTVPELIGRIRSYQEADPPIGVVLAAHSQGTVISAAALLGYPGIPPRLGFLTFGNVQGRIYARVFPRYFNARTFEALASRVATPGANGSRGWINLWRQSDFIGGRLMSDDVPGLDERELADPFPVSVPRYAVTHTPPLRHSDFWHDPAYHAALGDLTRSFAADGDICITGETGPALPRTVL